MFSDYRMFECACIVSLLTYHYNAFSASLNQIPLDKDINATTI